MKIVQSLPVQLIAVILFVFAVGKQLPLGFIQASFTLSELFKELLGLILPFMVFFFVVAGILSFKKNAPVVLAILLGAIFISNAIAAFLSFGVIQLVGSAILCQPHEVVTTAPTIEPFFRLNLALPLNAVHALLAALVVGLIMSFISLPKVQEIIVRSKEWIEHILTVYVIPLLPLYVLGFLLKIRYEGVLDCLLQQYGATFLLIVSLQIVWLFIVYFISCGFSLKTTLGAIKIAFPSYITAFSTMSSTATVPVSVKSATKNTNNRALADMAMPIMANVHLLGDSISTPILALVSMQLFLGGLPTFFQYMVFVFYFCSAMFAVSGIPGGGILVMIPVLITHLGFSAEMISVITTLYFLLDSFGTAANVMGDGALVILVNKILQRLRII